MSHEKRGNRFPEPWPRGTRWVLRATLARAVATLARPDIRTVEDYQRSWAESYIAKLVERGALESGFGTGQHAGRLRCRPAPGFGWAAVREALVALRVELRLTGGDWPWP